MAVAVAADGFEVTPMIFCALQSGSIVGDHEVQYEACICADTCAVRYENAATSGMDHFYAFVDLHKICSMSVEAFCNVMHFTETCSSCTRTGTEIRSARRTLSVA